MKKNNIKKMLIALGLVSGIVIGGVTVDLSNPDPVRELKSDPIYICQGEELKINKVKTCIGKDDYKILKAELKTRLKENGHVNPQDFAAHIAVLDREIKKRGGITIPDFNSELDLLTYLTNELL